MRKWMLMAAMVLAAATVRAASVTLDWDAVTTNADGSGISDLAGYRVFYATYSLTSLTVAQAMSAASVNKGASTSPTLTLSLANLTTYYFRVTAYDTSGNQSDFCDTPLEVSTVTPPAPTAPPASPGNPRLTAASPSEVDLSWTDVSGEDGYHVEWSLASNFGPVLGSTNVLANATAAAVKGLSAGTTYYFRLRSFNVAGPSAYVTVSGQTQADAFSGSGFAPPPGLKEAYAYPNPAKGVDPVLRAFMGGVDQVEVTIFDAAGRVVESGRTTNAVNVKGEPAFEYAWRGEKAPGIYYAVLHGRKGNETVRARATFAVVR